MYINEFIKKHFSGKNSIFVLRKNQFRKYNISSEFAKRNIDEFDKSKKYDVIVIDSINTYDDIKSNFNKALKILDKNGIIALANSNPINKRHCSPQQVADPWFGVVYKFVGELASNRKVDYVTICKDNGFSIVMNRKNPDVLDKQEITYELYNAQKNGLMRIILPTEFSKWYKNHYIAEKDIKNESSIKTRDDEVHRV